MTTYLKESLVKLRKFTPLAFEHFKVQHRDKAIEIPLWGDKFRTYTFSEETSVMKNPRNTKATLFGDINSSEVILLEGEWDLFAAYEAGLSNVVTGTNGANTFTEEMSVMLAGKTVNIIYDNDKAGVTGALKAAEILQEKGCKVKIVSLPDFVGNGGDVRDFLTIHKKTKEDVQELINGTSWFESLEDQQVSKSAKSVKRLSDVEVSPVIHLWKPYIAPKFITSLVGDPGVGKSRVAIQLAAAISKGGKVWDGTEIQKGKVLILSAEDPPSEVLRPRLEAAGANLEDIYAYDEPIYFDESGMKVIRALIKELKPILVIIDPIVSYLGGGVDMNRANEVREKFNFLSSIAREFELAILIVRHQNKAKQEKAIYAGSGSIDFVAAVRSEVMLSKHPDDPDLRVFGHIKCNLDKLGPSLILKMSETGLSYIQSDNRSIEQITRQFGLENKEVEEIDDLSKESLATKAIIECLIEGPMIRDEFNKDLASAGFAGKTLERALKRLEQVGQVRVSYTNSPRGHGASVIGLKSHLQCLKGKKFDGVDQLNEFLGSMNDQVGQNFHENRVGHEKSI